MKKVSLGENRTLLLQPKPDEKSKSPRIAQKREKLESTTWPSAPRVKIKKFGGEKRKKRAQNEQKCKNFKVDTIDPYNGGSKMVTSTKAKSSRKTQF